MSIGDKFKKEVNNKKEYVILITASAERYQKTNIEIIKVLINEQKIPGVYVTLNKPFEALQKILKDNNIDDRLIIFIDAVTQTPGNQAKRVPGCLFVGSPEKLSDISLAMDQAVKALSTEGKFIFFDSLDTLTLYNDLNIVVRFIHYLSGKMREWRIKGIIISLKKQSNKELIDDLIPFCDKKIDLGG